MNTFFSSGIKLRAGFKLLMAAIGRLSNESNISRCFGLVDVMQ